MSSTASAARSSPANSNSGLSTTMSPLFRMRNSSPTCKGGTKYRHEDYLYRFDAQKGEHVLRLLDPVADHKHLETHRRGD